MKVACIIGLGWVLAPSLSIAGGTVGLGEIDSLLRQKPALRDFLTSSLDLNDTAMAAVRFGPHFEHLSGGRMGPYLVEARPKGSKGGKPVELVLCTDARFVDEAGEVVANEMKATRVEEKLTVIILREVGSQPAIPECPEK